jgi:hypothetical protein
VANSVNPVSQCIGIISASCCARVGNIRGLHGRNVQSHHHGSHKDFLGLYFLERVSILIYYFQNHFYHSTLYNNLALNKKDRHVLIPDSETNDTHVQSFFPLSYALLTASAFLLMC